MKEKKRKREKYGIYNTKIQWWVVGASKLCNKPDPLMQVLVREEHSVHEYNLQQTLNNYLQNTVI